MAADNQLIKGFVNFQGLDLRSSDLERRPEFATELKNVEYRKSGAMSKRKGYQGRSFEEGGYGLGNYADLNVSTGQISERLISIDSNGHVMAEENLTITYTGPDSAYCDFYYSETEGEFALDVYDNNVLVLHELVGVVIDEASFIPLSDLITDINALTNFSASASGATTVPAAFLNITRNLDITSAGADIKYEYWSQMSLPTSAPTPFTVAQTKINEEDFENATFANINNVIYIATGYDPLYKYDGTRLYKAGLPTASIDSVALGGAGAITATNIQYKAVYEYTDAKGNIITSIESDLSAKISPAAQSVDITVDNILNTTGYDTDSVNLIIRLYRNRVEDSTTFYEVAFVANDAFNATQIINDNIAIGSEGIEFIDPIKPHGLPPIGKYLTVHQGLLIISGDNTNVNNVYYSDIDSPEYFPAGDNAFLCETVSGDKVTGLAPLGNSLFVFKDKSVFQIVGTMAEDIFRVDLYGSARVGCTSHHSIAEVNGFLFFLSAKGIFALNQNEQSLTEVSEIVESKFTDCNLTYNPKKVTAINWLDADKYMIHLPTNTDDHSTSSNIMVYDYYRKAWLEWDSINAMGGLQLKNKQLYFQEREFRTLSGSTERHTYIIKDTCDTWDYADHNNAIEFAYKSHWEALQEPSLFKKFTRCKIHSLGLSTDDFESDGFDLDLETETDYFNTPRTIANLNFRGSNGGWGLDPWGIFAWGATRLIGRTIKLKPMKCRSLRLILQNDTIHENVLISGYEFEVAPSYKAFIKE
jgi:hypothetical protein